MTAPSQPRSPAHEASRDARGRLDRAIAAIRLVPIRFERAPISDALQRAMAAMYVALDTDVEVLGHDEAVDEAIDALGAAIALLQPIATTRDVGGSLRAVLVELDEARVSMSGAADAIASHRLSRRNVARGGRGPAAEPPVAAFRASIGTPRLHTIERPRLQDDLSLEPAVPIAERRRKKSGKPLPAAALKALADAARRGDAAHAMLGDEPPPSPPLPPVIEALEREEIRRVAEDCLADIGTLGLLRAPGPTEKWIDAAAFEQRLLDLLDAFASLGAEVLPLVPLHLLASSTPDASRAFAATFVLGCIAGSDAASKVVDLLLGAPPEARVASRDAVALASSPAIDAALVDRLQRGLPAEPRAIAIGALLARGVTLPVGLLGDVLQAPRAARPLLARALESAASGHETIARLEDLRDLDDEEGEPSSDDTFFAATEALLRQGNARARELLRRSVDRGGVRADRAAALLCLCGGSDDVTRLVRRFVDAPSRSLARGLGRFGHVESLAALVNALDLDDEALTQDVAGALARITGAPIVTTVEIPWGEGAPPPVEGEAPRPVRKVQSPSRDRAAWAFWLAREGRALDRSIRHRLGVPMHLLQIVDELLDEGTPLADRADAARELALSGVSTRPFRIDDWVARQRAFLAERRADLERARIATGRWGRANV